MSRNWTGILAVVALLVGCAPFSSTRQSATAPQIVGAPPGKAVIYLVRTRPDLSYLTATVTLDGQLIGSTHAGTYFRLEVAPGRHRLSGYSHDNGDITLDVQADRTYFVQHTVAGSWRSTNPQSFFRLIDEARGRAAMTGAISAAG